MIFKHTYTQVLNGTKTQTRRPVKPGELAQLLGDKIVAVWIPKKGGVPLLDIHTLRRPTALEEPDEVFRQGYRRKWRVGDTYAVQPGRGKKSVGRTPPLKEIRRERLQEISLEDVIAEGFAYRDVWWTADVKMFQLTWDNLYDEPYRWEDNPEVWVLEFERADNL